MRLTLLITSALLLLLASCSLKTVSTNVVPTNAVSPAIDDAPKIELISKHASRDSLNNLVIVGEIRNISSEPIAFVGPVVSIYDRKGTLVKTADGLVDFQPMKPGSTSPFKFILESAGAERATYKIAFEDKNFQRMPYVDKSKK